jgi:hypothetical protein
LQPPVWCWLPGRPRLRCSNRRERPPRLFFNSNYVAANTIDGSGLTGAGTDITEAHAAYSSSSGGNHWTTTNSNPLLQWIDWTFSAPVTMGAAWIWNHVERRTGGESRL